MTKTVQNGGNRKTALFSKLSKTVDEGAWETALFSGKAKK